MNAFSNATVKNMVCATTALLVTLAFSLIFVEASAVVHPTAGAQVSGLDHRI